MSGPLAEGRRPPLRVAVLVLEHASLLTLGSTLDPLRCANRHLGYEAFRWTIVSPGLSEVALTCGFTIPAVPDLAAAEGADLLLVIAGFRIGEVATRATIQTIQRISGGIGTIGAVDAGAWVLAKAGLLDGYRATTHWEDLEDFAASFPEVTVVPDRYVVSRNRITAGGAAPAFDMMVGLIRARHGAQVALEVASSFITTVLSPSEPQLQVRRGEPGVDARVARAASLMESRIDSPLAVADVARAVGLTARRLEALFRAAYGVTPGAFFLEMRLQAAKRMIVDTRHPLAFIALRSGFSSPASFSRAFGQRFGESPSAFRGKHAGHSGYVA